MNQRSTLALLAKAAIFGAALLLLAPLALAADGDPAGQNPIKPARAGDFTLKVEPGVAIPMTNPQSDLFNVGGGLTVKALWNLNRYLDLGPAMTYLALPSDAETNVIGTAFTFGASLRLKRPHDAPDNDKFYALSPWVDADLMYVRTGDLDRPAFAVGAGLSVPIGASRVFWIGPYVRYLQIMQFARTNFNTDDAKILLVGVSLEVGSGVEREGDAVAAAEVRTVNKEIVKETKYCPDRDGDGVPDSVDLCPDVKGTLENYGCPGYKKLVVKKDKLELKEKLFFDWDKATLDKESYDTLDEVALALNENKGFTVQVQGHASSEGSYDHNQDLSEARAQAVLDYLVKKGVAKNRLNSKGFSSSQPRDTNTTLVGREANRRVEFVVHFIIVNEGSK